MEAKQGVKSQYMTTDTIVKCLAYSVVTLKRIHRQLVFFPSQKNGISTLVVLVTLINNNAERRSGYA